MTAMVTNVTNDFLVTMFTLVTKVTNVFTVTTATVVTMVTTATVVTTVTTATVVTMVTTATVVTTVTTATVVTMVTSFHWFLWFRQHTGSSTLGKLPVLFGSMIEVCEIRYKYHSIK